MIPVTNIVPTIASTPSRRYCSQERVLLCPIGNKCSTVLISYHHVIFMRFLTLQQLLLFLASTTEPIRETLAQLVYKALRGICLQMYDVELAARHFQETFNLVQLGENTTITTY